MIMRRTHTNRQNVHCVGIGGIGVSALARYYLALGWRVTGSDLAASEITVALKRRGIPIAIGQPSQRHLPKSATLVVHTSAVPKNHPELMAARKRRIQTRSYPEALGDLTRQLHTIAIAGAHGKSTTTALASLVAIAGGIDPTVIIGTKLREFGNTNFRRGHSNWLIIEADEYRAAFLHYRPKIAIVTNIDREHLDFYRNTDAIVHAFEQFLSAVPRAGCAILNRDDARVREIGRRLARSGTRIRWFSRWNPESQRIARIIRIPGRHNLQNALAAYRVGEELGIPPKRILAALGQYRGAWRRFEYQGTWSGAKIFADYAHHPTEIRATLEGARERYPKSRIITVFQPHHSERMRYLFHEFTRAFGAADRVLVLPVYEVAGRETKWNDPRKNSAALANAINQRGTATRYLGDTTRLSHELKKETRRGDIVILMGAGSIWEMTKRLIKD